MNTQEEINNWIKNQNSKKLWEQISLIPCYGPFISKFQINYYYIDDSHGNLILQWSRENKTYYVEHTNTYSTFSIFNDTKQMINNGYSDKFCDVIHDLTLEMNGL